jgi:hypothetical protein
MTEITPEDREHFRKKLVEIAEPYRKRGMKIPDIRQFIIEHIEEMVTVSI